MARILLTIWLVACSTTALGASASGNKRCLYCHGNKEIAEMLSAERQAMVRQMPGVEPREDPASLYVAPEAYDHSVHREITCTSCHKDCNLLPHAIRTSPAQCGDCHSEPQEEYSGSVHGQAVAAGKRGPVCATCHTVHHAVEPPTTAHKMLSDERCGQCHQDRLERYQETFHGKAVTLGMEGAAACYDCHGHHDMPPLNDSSSRLSENNKAETCRQCHPKATREFADYIAHADHTDREHYPILFWTFVFMTALVLGVFVFFAIHTLLWLIRSGIAYWRDPVLFRESKFKTLNDDEVFVRFSRFERFLHVLVITSFLLLVATGMPLKFYYMDWAHWMVRLMGGLKVAGLLHRVGAVVTFLYFGLHLLTLVQILIRRRGELRNPETGRYSLRQCLRLSFGPDSPLPNFDDVRDFWAHQKWFFGRGPRPTFDRWTYWEKFDYFAVFWGVAIIGFSGLVLWFPEEFTHILPGWIINAALIVHSDEALLAAGYIFMFHFFNTHFRPGKFPMDAVIFSGRITRAEMQHERKRWHDRLVESGQLDQIRLRDEPIRWKRVIYLMGFLAFSTGLVLLVLIVYAMGSRLMGN